MRRQVVAIAGSGWLVQVFGRKTVLIGAALLTGLGQMVVAAFFQFEVSPRDYSLSGNILLETHIGIKDDL